MTFDTGVISSFPLEPSEEHENEFEAICYGNKRIEVYDSKNEDLVYYEYIVTPNEVDKLLEGQDTVIHCLCAVGDYIEVTQEVVYFYYMQELKAVMPWEDFLALVMFGENDE